MPRYRMVCATCGSEDVLADAYVQWSVELQEWTIANVFDKGHYCDNCDGECKIDEDPIEEPETPDYLRALLVEHNYTELQRELATLKAANEAATSWGAAVGARSERIRAIENILREVDES